MTKDLTRERAVTKDRSIRDNAEPLVSIERIDRCILTIRGQKVMLDADLAAFYGVSSKRLNEQVRRNPDRFPADFVFQLTTEDVDALRSQNATLDVIGLTPSNGYPEAEARGQHRKYRPLAFTEHGAIMAASVLKSERAVQMSVLVVRAFVRLRHFLATHADLARRIEDLEREFTNKSTEHEQHIRRIYEILDDLMNPPPAPPKGRIGFTG
jgi:hypothetical protein